MSAALTSEEEPNRRKDYSHLELPFGSQVVEIQWSLLPRDDAQTAIAGNRPGVSIPSGEGSDAQTARCWFGNLVNTPRTNLPIGELLPGGKINSAFAQKHTRTPTHLEHHLFEDLKAHWLESTKTKSDCRLAFLDPVGVRGRSRSVLF